MKLPERIRRPWEAEKQTQQQSRGESTQKYRRTAWRKLRAAYVQSNPICVQCHADGVIAPVQEVDHIVPVRLGGNMYDWANLQSLCRTHHAQKSISERGRGRNSTENKG